MPFHSLGRTCDNQVSFWLFRFPAEKLGGFPSLEPGTGCIGFEHCALRTAAQGPDRKD